MWLFGCLFAVVAAVALLKHYAEPGIRWEFLSLVGFSWALGFMYFLVLPFDIEHAFCQACIARTQDASECRCLPSMGIELLETIIPVAYGCARQSRMRVARDPAAPSRLLPPLQHHDAAGLRDERRHPRVPAVRRVYPERAVQGRSERGGHLLRARADHRPHVRFLPRVRDIDPSQQLAPTTFRWPASSSTSSSRAGTR